MPTSRRRAVAHHIHTFGPEIVVLFLVLALGMLAALIAALLN
jgi:hypothetical protein